MPSKSTIASCRTAAFLASAALIAGVVWLLSRLAHVRIGGDYSSQTVLIPLLTAYVLWNERERIFAIQESAAWKGVQFAGCSAIVGLVAWHFQRSGSAYLFCVTSLLAAFLLLVASFTSLYGWRALHRAVFPFCLLLLAIPLPDSVVQGIISTLQAQSTWLSATLFSLIGIPVYQHGFLLTVPGVTIEVARECSGINSSIGLVLTMLLVARQSLNSNWRRAVLVLATIPLSILKNAIRITTLTVLALRVDPGFLTGRLHHQGGFVFYLIAMALMYPIWKMLKAGDKVADSKPQAMIWHNSTEHSAPQVHTIG